MLLTLMMPTMMMNLTQHNHLHQGLLQLRINHQGLLRAHIMVVKNMK